VPRDAAILIDGAHLPLPRDGSTSSMTIPLPRSDRPVVVTIRAKGYRTLRRTVVPDRDVSWKAVLKKPPRTPSEICPDDDLDCVLPPL
jgi:hypothetical protein